MNDQHTRFTLHRISGMAEIDLTYGTQASEAQAYIRMPQIRAFHVLALGRPVEEFPRLMARISGMCPWHHHLAAMLAVEDALSVDVPPAAQHIRELVLLLAHISAKILHIYIMSSPDISPDMAVQQNLFNSLMNASTPRAAMETRCCVGRMLKALTGQDWGGEVAVLGGQSYSVRGLNMDNMHKEITAIRAFCLHGMEKARGLLRPVFRAYQSLDNLPLISLGGVESSGALNLASTANTQLLRLIHPDGNSTHFLARDYPAHIVEEYADWTQCAFLRLRTAAGLCLNPDTPDGVFRVGPLARLHACAYIDTPLAQQELERFRTEYGPYPQNTMLYHWARLIELLYCVEKVAALLDQFDSTDEDIRTLYVPAAPCATRHGFAHLEAPRGSLFYRISVDENDCISACDILTPTACNNAAMNISLTHAVRESLHARMPEHQRVPMLNACVRAYDPCPACATHALSAQISPSPREDLP